MKTVKVYTSFKDFKRKTDNKMRGAYGETDYKKGTIRVNKKLAREKPMFKRPVNKHASRYPDVLDTIVHEKKHVDSPKMLEKNVRKYAKRMVKTMTRTQKQRHYALFA